METINRLSEKTCLSERVAVYVPSTLDVNNSIENTFHVNEVAKKMSNLFGGCTTSDNHGFWMSEKIGLVGEKVTIVYSYTDSITNEKIDNLLSICEWLKVEMIQEAISLEINGKLYFI